MVALCDITTTEVFKMCFFFHKIKTIFLFKGGQTEDTVARVMKHN